MPRCAMIELYTKSPPKIILWSIRYIIYLKAIARVVGIYAIFFVMAWTKTLQIIMIKTQ